MAADSPAGYWRLDEPAGGTLGDGSGNNQSGSYINSPTLGLTGVSSGDGAAGFNGASQYAQVAYARSMNDPRDRVQEPWRSAFVALGAEPGFRAIQKAMSASTSA